MTVMILGSEGQLGLALMNGRPKEADVVPLDMEVDITNPDALKKAFAQHKPKVVVNAAAYTNVEGAEDDEMTALAVNGEAPGHIVELADEHGARMIQVSTDFVFDGKHHRPYTPEDEAAPLSVYGLSKLKGERAVLASDGNHAVVRTSWLYFYYGNNFVQTMLRLFNERDELTVVADQVGTPTSAITLAALIWKMVAAEPEAMKGLWHYSDCGVASWYDFAVTIQGMAFAQGLLQEPCTILPVSSDEYPTKAHRPFYSVMDSSKTRERFEFPAIPWMMALREVMAESVILPKK